MRFTVSSNALNQRLQNIRGVISGKNTINILDCFLFEFNGTDLTITGSDGDNRLITHLELAECDVDKASICINAKTILDTLKELPDQPLTLQVDVERGTINGQYCNGEFNITCQPAKDYPEYKELTEGTKTTVLPAADLLSGLTRCMTCTKDDGIRPVMSGVLMDNTPEKTTFVATDGHKLMRSATPRSQVAEPYSVIIPKKSLMLLRTLLAKDEGGATVTTTASTLDVRTSEYHLIGKLIEGRYPNYNAVIPANNPHHIVIDRLSLLSATRRVTVFSSQSSTLVKLRFDAGSCTLSGQDYEYSTSAEEHVLCQYDGPSVTIGFKGSQLSEMLTLVDSAEVRLELADPSKPGLIIPTETQNDEDILMLLMPMMVKD